MTSVVQSSYSIFMSRSGITIARSIILVGFDAPTTSYDVDFRVIFLVVGLKIGSSVNLILDTVSELIFDSASELTFEFMFDSGISEVVEPVTSLTSLKVIFRLVRTILLIKSHNLKMVVTSYLNSYSFSDRGASLSSSLICGLSAYAAYPKVLICL
jgi:hypothetical protein